MALWPHKQSCIPASAGSFKHRRRSTLLPRVPLLDSAHVCTASNQRGVRKRKLATEMTTTACPRRATYPSRIIWI